MDKKKITSIVERIQEANNLLEICRGYAQSEAPDMVTLSETLYMIKVKYDVICMALEKCKRD